MAKKKKTATPARSPQFSATPFTVLKGIVAVMPAPAAEPAPKTVPPAPPNDDDADLFLQAMGGVKQLDRTVKEQGSPQKNIPVPSEKTASAAALKISAADELFLQEIGRLKLEVKFAETLPDEDELKPISGNRLKQLKRGIVSVDYQLDLHGLTRDEALSELPRFLRSARVKGQKAVLVITGKGNNSIAEPVLQQAVAAWLRDAGKELVLEFAPAPREMGGSGAFVVFLRPLPAVTAKSPV